MFNQVLQAKSTYLKFLIRGKMIPNWLWRSQDPIGPQIRVFDTPRRHIERARPMGADLWALDAWA